MDVFAESSVAAPRRLSKARRLAHAWGLGLALWLAGTSGLHAAETRRVVATVQSIEGTVLYARARADTWDPVYLGQKLYDGDRVRTGEDSRVAFQLPDLSVVRFGEKSDHTIVATPEGEKPKTRFNLRAGLMYFFHRGKPADAEVETRTASAAIRGTEFVVEQAEDGRTLVTVFDGEVELRNTEGSVRVESGERGVATPGQVPTAAPALDLANVIQWALYYPGVLDPGELPLADEEKASLRESLEHYRAGALGAALQAFPRDLPNPSAAARLLLASLRLSVGQVVAAQEELDRLGQAGEQITRLADALRQVIATVKGETWDAPRSPELATEWLATSFHEQARHRLEAALAAARAVVARSPGFSFGWARVAEMEFSFGRVGAAEEALSRALDLAPRQAQAVALRGFLLAAQNRIRAAEAEFERAIQLDSALANAWLGRGLSRIRSGRGEEGRDDLLVAAALEPRRAALRSYLAKAWADTRFEDKAAHELELAKLLDPRDPTAFLYAALLKEQGGQINDAVRELEQAQALGDNRRLYRSRLLLDQDRAVRSVNLARLYREAGLDEVSLREAGRAVAEDYGNYSAHLFLANSYDQFRDPNRINLRYETPAEAEYLIANLLAPAGAGTLSQSISQGEYSKLFERDGPHVVSSTEYLSRGAWSQNGAQFGTFGNTSYSLEGVYRTDPGQWFNGDFEERELRLHFKQQLTPQDSLYFRVVEYESSGGDRFQRLDPTLDYYSGGPNPDLRTRETQRPALVLGYAHKWNPGSRLLFLAGRIEDTYEVSDPSAPTLMKFEFDGAFNALAPIGIQQSATTEAVVYTSELQQIWQTPKHLTVIGGRYQRGDLEVENTHREPTDYMEWFPVNGFTRRMETSFARLSLYGYHSWQVLEPLALTGGASYDWMEYPENFRAAPMSDGEESLSRLHPKAGFIWKPDQRTAIRGAYSKSLGGTTLDQSLRLEPTQVAGLNQAFRSTIPESLVGSTSGDRAELLALSVERNFAHGTYAGLAGELLRSRSPRTLGAYTFDATIDPNEVFPGSLREELKYQERSLTLSVHQLAGKYFSFGARYRVSEASLRTLFPEVGPGTVLVQPLQRSSRQRSLLQEAELRAVFNHPSGFFGQLSGLWNAQQDLGSGSSRPNEDVWTMDAFIGYRLPRRNAQFTLGVLNLLDRDYRLHPLNLHAERPRERTLVCRADFAF